jgi:nucleoid-associated protein YgaU
MARRYENIGTYTTDDGKVIYLPTKYPSVATSNDDFYIITQATDRLDLIASDFYGDSTLWWVIAMANDLPGDSLFTTPGFQLRIPGNLDNAIQEFNALNS